MKMNSILHIATLICLFRCGWSQNSRITCPRAFYKEGTSSIDLKIDASTFTVCDAGPTSVTCRWFPQTGTPTTICIQSVTNCDTDVTSRGCRCLQQNGQVYSYSLEFSMLPNQEKGNINCSLDCFVTGSGPKATVDSDSTCHDIAFVGKCDQNPCSNDGHCLVDSKSNLVCDCRNTNYRGERCEVLIGAVIGVIVLPIIILVLLVFILCCIITLCRERFECVIVFWEMTSEEKKILEEFVNSPTDPLGEIIEAPLYCWCFCQCEVETKVCGKGINRTGCDIKPPRVIVRGRLICYFALKTRANEVYERVLAEFRNRGHEPPSEPVDCPPR